MQIGSLLRLVNRLLPFIFETLLPKAFEYIQLLFVGLSRFAQSRRVFQYVLGPLALVVLVGSFVLPWVEVPASSLEHKAHISIAAIEERSPASRRQIRPGDIVTQIGDTSVSGLSLEAAQQVYAETLNEVLRSGGDGVPIETFRGNERAEIVLPLPRYNKVFELKLPVRGKTEDIGLTLAAVEPRALRSPAGTSSSAMRIWLGGNEDIPTLDLKKLSEGKSGFKAVRGLDRWLILLPLGALALLGLVWLHLSERLTTRQALWRMAVVALFLVVLPVVWQAFSINNWRGYLKETYPGERDASVISSEIVKTYNLPTLAITAKVSRQQRNVDLVNAVAFELNKVFQPDLFRLACLILFMVCGGGFVLVGLQEAGALANRDRLVAVIMLSPSLILLMIFVYVFIARTFQFSLTDWGEESKGAPAPLTKNVARTFIGTENYQDLMSDQPEFYFRDSLVNTFFFTLFFLVGCLVFGFFLAFLVDQRVKGEGIFRTIFLFPMSLSLVVTGTIWRWLLQPSGGINVLPQKITNLTIGGRHILPEFLRMEALDNQWMNSRATLWGFSWDEARVLVYLGIALFGVVVFNYLLRASTRQTAYILLITFGFWLFYALGWWSKVWPGLDDPLAELEKGYRVALSGVIIAAVWQMSGYVMALFLAGIRGVPDDLREAARVDGCAEWQVYFYVILPSLRPIALSAIIILGHISLKIFDLVFAMAGPDNNQTIVPGILLYTKAFRGNRLASGSAVAMVMLVLVSIVIVPYLWTSLRREESQ